MITKLHPRGKSRYLRYCPLLCVHDQPAHGHLRPEGGCRRGPQVWSTATAADGLDSRLEIALLDGETRIAIRDSRYPSGPALVFSRDSWTALLGGEPELVDLR